MMMMVETMQVKVINIAAGHLLREPVSKTRINNEDVLYTSALVVPIETTYCWADTSSLIEIAIQGSSNSVSLI